MMNQEKIFVVGINSFSGSNFVSKALDSGFKVRTISRSSEALEVFLHYRWLGEPNEDGLNQKKRIHSN